MKELFLTKKTGFDVLTPEMPINIRDYRGIMFYSTEAIAPKVKKFNLPAGKYFIDSGHFKKAEKPRVYKLPKLPPFERSLMVPFDFKIVFQDNPNKCTVSWKKRLIIFDNSFKEHPLPHVYFILYHEYGHSKYSTEKYCDIFASRLMLRKGFNPSQVGQSPVLTLSENQGERKENIVSFFAS